MKKSIREAKAAQIERVEAAHRALLDDARPSMCALREMPLDDLRAAFSAALSVGDEQVIRDIGSVIEGRLLGFPRRGVAS